MDCREFDRRLDRLFDGACAPVEWREAEAHAAGCARCQRLFEALSGKLDGLDASGHAALTASVLERTSGSACGACRGRLCEFVDGELAALDRGLVESHLAGCTECRALADALARSALLLPSFAELAPPPSFAAEVLAVTSRRQTTPVLGERLAAWLARAVARPRFSVEVAYVVTLLLILLLGDPVRAFRSTTEKGASYVRPRAEIVAQEVTGRLAGIRRAGAETADALASFARRPDTRSASWDAGVGAVRQWLRANLEAPLSAMVERVFHGVRAALDALERFLQEIWAGAPQTPPQSPKGTGATEPSAEAVRLS